MKISLITVSFNSAETIRDTIESVKSQTYKNIDYIIIDGASNDNTLGIIEEYIPVFGDRLRTISEKDKGLYDAMNKGIKMVNGEVIGFINSDDLFIDKYSIEKIMRIFEKDNKLESVYANLYYVSKHDTSKIIRNWVTGKRKSFKSGWHPAHPALFLRKTVYEKYGLFDLQFKLAADFELMLRFFERYKISSFYLDETIIKMRLGGKTNSSIQNILKQNVECLRAFRVNGQKVNNLAYLFLRTIPKLIQYR